MEVLRKARWKFPSNFSFGNSRVNWGNHTLVTLVNIYLSACWLSWLSGHWMCWLIRPLRSKPSSFSWYVIKQGSLWAFRNSSSWSHLEIGINTGYPGAKYYAAPVPVCATSTCATCFSSVGLIIHDSIGTLFQLKKTDIPLSIIASWSCLWVSFAGLLLVRRQVPVRLGRFLTYLWYSSLPFHSVVYECPPLSPDMEDVIPDWRAIGSTSTWNKDQENMTRMPVTNCS